ncbi:cytochrome P450 [Bisporella sp. PMI_857]|nr:cytochrome P450 [Bisporella sp. PMI_857]
MMEFIGYRLAISLLLLLSLLLRIYKSFRAYLSPLSHIPGPWYAPLTTLHLRYGFSTGRIWKLAEKSHKSYGSIVRLGPRQVWISDKEAIKQILVTRDLPKVAMYAEISRDRTSPGLFGEIRYEPHKRLKRFLSPAFTVSYIDNLETLFQDCIQDLINKYQNLIDAKPLQASISGIETDFMEDLHNVALDIMGESSFGKGFGQTNPEKGAEDGVEEQVWKSIPTAIFNGLSRRYQTVYIKRFLRPLGLHLEFDWPAQMIKAIDVIVQKRKLSNSLSRPDLLQHLIDEGLKPDTGVKMSTRNIVDQGSEILLAGSETTSGTLGSLFLSLARNPIVKAKLLSTLPPLARNSKIITSKTIRTDPRYEYLNACIKENLRLHPIASEMGRRTGNSWVNLCGYELPPHTVVSASYRALMRNEEWWPEAERFWPERWLEDRGDAPAPNMDAYYPFSGGKHSCIGINFAWAEMRMVAANVLSRFDIEEVPGQNVDYRQYITMQFTTGSWKARLKPRTVSLV